MSAGAGPIQAGNGSDGGRMRPLSLEDLDRRTRAYQRIKETRAEVISDLGGEDQLSTLERIAADNVAMLDTMLKDVSARWLHGEAIDAADIATLQNTFNRTAAALGWQRRSRDVTPSLDAYLRAKDDTSR
ncbi:MAG: hypothetical protein ABWY64_20425 [Tardiphaga sp.]